MLTQTCCEQYWQALASYQKDDAIQLMQSLNAPLLDGTSEGDFFLMDPVTNCSVYNPKNDWNYRTTGGSIMHLIHPSNTLGAEIDIAAQATVIRKDDDGNVITDPQELIQCSKYGNPGRNSDPSVSSIRLPRGWRPPMREIQIERKQGAKSW